MNYDDFAFVTCIKDSDKYLNLNNSINKLNDYEYIKKYKTWGAESMTHGYNIFSHWPGYEIEDNKKYKIYIHDDVEILNFNLINDCLKIFEDSKIAVIGFAGAKWMPESQVFWEADQLFGQVVENRGGGDALLKFQQPQNDYEQVEMIDGFCMITQYDIPWDERITGFHFYDASQCLQFRKKGYKVVIPKQESPWFKHNIGLKDFDANLYLRCRDNYKKIYGL